MATLISQGSAIVYLQQNANLFKKGVFLIVKVGGIHKLISKCY
jgi:hypothetical protein